MAQNTSHAVMAQRVEAPDSLDYFPTPPWATRALCEWLLASTRGVTLGLMSCWEPACGGGHMAKPLAQYFENVKATDAHDYGYGGVSDFLFDDTEVDWIITNPPFRLAAQFAQHALPLAKIGVAMLCRSVFLEGGERWRELYDKTPPTDVLIFSERVPMLRGRLERTASSATSYAWFVWRSEWRRFDDYETHLHWIPPGTRKRLERDSDYASYSAQLNGGTE